MDLMLTEVSKRFITIKDDDFKKSQVVFKTVFENLKDKMEEKCNFLKHYCRQVIYAGSVADGTKLSQLDEIDMDIVIRLPINYDQSPDGITIENDQPGFVKMKIANAFDNLDKQQHWESRHKVTREWRDSDNYFLQNKFRNWLQGVIQKAINDMNMQAEVEGVRYLLTYKESGPAYTLNIRNDVGNEPFALDVDIVPVIKFRTPRWPSGYKTVEGIRAKDWLVVPKANKSSPDDNAKNRCWRLSFQEQEKELLKGCLTLKSCIRLIKKLRDALRLKAIASYYIKTLFLWKVIAEDKTYWQNKLCIIFQDMVEEFYLAVKNKSIPYFWQEENNLLDNLKPSLQVVYVTKLKNVLCAIVTDDAKSVVKAILTDKEHEEFAKSEFYQSEIAKQALIDTGISLNLSEEIILLRDELDERSNQMNSNDFKILESKFYNLSVRLAIIEDKLEIKRNVSEYSLENGITKAADVNNTSAAVPVSVELPTALNSKDEESYTNDVEVKGVPEMEGEDAFEIVEMIASKIGIELENETVEAYRSGVPQLVCAEGEVPRPIVVRCGRRDLCDRLLRAARSHRPLTTNSIDLSGDPRQIYIHERLTKEKQRLFDKTVKKARNKNWKYVWTKKGRILVKKTHDDVVHNINSDLDIFKLLV